MADTFNNYNINLLPERIKKVRRIRSEQYKSAKKHFNDVKKNNNKNSQEYKNAIKYYQQYERFNICTSQKALADAIDVSRQTIIDWEKGNTYPSIENLINLCSKFDCNMDYILGSIETPITEPISIAHYFSHIEPSIIKYGLENDDYLRFLNFFMLPENCASLFNDIHISEFSNYIKKYEIDEIQSPLREDIIKAYEEYNAITPIQDISHTTYKSFLKDKFPEEKIILTNTPTENGYSLKMSFNKIAYQNFFKDQEFDYSLFIDYLVEQTFDKQFYKLIFEAQKIKIAKSFIELLEKYLSL